MPSWRGKGGGIGLSIIKKINLTLDEIINVIKCGRPGTGMPYFLKKPIKKKML